MSRVENPYNLGSGAKVGGVAADLMKKLGSNLAAITGAKTELAKFKMSLDHYGVESEKDRQHELALRDVDNEHEIRSKSLDNEHEASMVQLNHQNNIAMLAPIGSLAKEAADRGQNLSVKTGPGTVDYSASGTVKKVNRELGEHLPEQHRKAYIMGSAAQKAALTRKYGAA